MRQTGSKVRNVASRAKVGTTKPVSVRQPATLYVCRSCVWSEAQRERDDRRQGDFLLEAINQEIERVPLPQNTGLRAVHCLNGCKTPCNVAFRSPGKHGLRFSNLTPENAGEVLSFLGAYFESDVGNIPEGDIPEGLRGKLTVRTPPPPIRKINRLK